MKNIINTNIGEKRGVIVIDCGKNHSTYFNNTTGKTKKIKRSDVLKLPSKYPGFLFIAEDAHLGVPRNGKSMAQIFDKKKLSQFYEDCRSNGVTLKLFPQQLSPRASLYVGVEKSDDNDPEIIYKFLKDHPEIHLKNPRDNFEYSFLEKEGYEFKNHCNMKLNSLRMTEEDKCSYSEEDVIPKFVIDNLDHLNEVLSSEAKDAFGLTIERKSEKKRKTIKTTLHNGKEVDHYRVCINKYAKTTKYGEKGDWKVKTPTGGINMNQLCSILAPMLGVIEYNQEEDALELKDKLNKRRHTGELPCWKFVKSKVFEFKPFHQKGGVARSNLIHHGLKNYVRRKVKRCEGLDLERKVDHPYKKKNGKAKPIYINTALFTSEEKDVFKKYRKQYQKCTQEVFNVFRNLLLQREKI